MRKRKIPLAGTLQNNPISTEEIADIAADIQRELETYADPVKREYLPRFFKTGKGEYGEGDKFLGVVVPNTRTVAKQHKDAPFAVMAELLQSQWHECRLCALLMLVERFKKSGEKERKLIYDFYLSQTARINNWDLVDLSAAQIVGGYLEEQDHTPLYRLAQSSLIWEQRISIVSTWQWIRKGRFDDTLAIADILLYNKHDLIRKAVGWMLREVGKKDKIRLCTFLDTRYRDMPRTMLRYAIEKFSPEERRHYMQK